MYVLSKHILLVYKKFQNQQSLLQINIQLKRRIQINKLRLFIHTLNFQF